MNADPLGRFALLAAIDRPAMAVDPRLCRGSRHADDGPIGWPRHQRALRIEQSSRHFSLSHSVRINLSAVNSKYQFALDKIEFAAYLV